MLVRSLPGKAVGLAIVVAALAAQPSMVSAEKVLVASNTVYAVDVDEGTVETVVSLGRFVKSMAVDGAGERAYIATSGGIHELDLATGRVTRMFGNEPARSVELDRASGTLFGLFLPGDGMPPRLRIFSLSSGEEIGSEPLADRTTSLHFREASGTIFGSEMGERRLSFHDDVSGAGQSEIVFPDRNRKPGYSDVLGDPLVDPASGAIIVPVQGVKAGVWVVRDGAEPEWIGLGHGGSFHGSVLSPDGRYLYLSALDHVSKVDLVEKRELAWVGLDGAHQRIGISADGTRLYLTYPVTGDGGALTVLSADDLSLVRRIDVAGASPYALAVVPD